MIKDRLDGLIANAMRAKDTVGLKVLRLIKSEFQKFETTKNNKGVLNTIDDASEIRILKKMLTQWEEETSLFEQAHRDTSSSIAENNYLRNLIPSEPSIEEQRFGVKQIIEAYMLGLPIEERRGMKHLGSIMKIVKGHYPTIDGKMVSDTYKQMIGHDDN